MTAMKFVSKYGPELNYLKVFYYPQDAPVEMGPTEVLPGSHFLYAATCGPPWVPNYIEHYGGIRGGVKTAAPAGSIFITVFSLWHRRSPSTASGMRNLLKYHYWRTVPPQQDWIREPDFDFAAADYGEHGQRSARMFYWLCGKVNEFRSIGGQGWPFPYGQHTNQMGKSYGFPSGPARW